MSGFLTNGVRDIIAILGMISSFISIYYIFKPPLYKKTNARKAVKKSNRLPDAAHSPTTQNHSVPHSPNHSSKKDSGLFGAIKLAWKNDAGDLKTTMQLVFGFWILAIILTIVFPSEPGPMAGVFLLKNIGFTVAFFDLSTYFKEEYSSKPYVFKLRAIVFCFFAIVSLVTFLFQDHIMNQRAWYINIFVNDLISIVIIMIISIGGALIDFFREKLRF